MAPSAVGSRVACVSHVCHMCALGSEGSESRVRLELREVSRQKRGALQFGVGKGGVLRAATGHFSHSMVNLLILGFQ